MWPSEGKIQQNCLFLHFYKFFFKNIFCFFLSSCCWCRPTNYVRYSQLHSLNSYVIYHSVNVLFIYMFFPILSYILIYAHVQCSYDLFVLCLLSTTFLYLITCSKIIITLAVLEPLSSFSDGRERQKKNTHNVIII